MLFEFKYVARKDLGKRGKELRDLDSAALRKLPAVDRAFSEASQQLRAYRGALVRRRAEGLDLKCYAVVAVGLERLLGEEPS